LLNYNREKPHIFRTGSRGGQHGTMALANCPSEYMSQKSCLALRKMSPKPLCLQMDTSLSDRGDNSQEVTVKLPNYKVAKEWHSCLAECSTANQPARSIFLSAK
jgi:hypothetical protein